MDKKYKLLTDDTISSCGRTLYRIEALKDFGNVKKGDKGGYLEKEDNLSHEGQCWVYHEARVLEKAMVFGKARVYGRAKVFGDARVYGGAMVSGDAVVYGRAMVYDDARIYGNAEVYGDAEIYGNVCVSGITKIHGNAEVYGIAEVYGNAEIYGNVVVKSDKDYIVFKNWWGSGRYFTWTRSNNMWSVGCFYGTGDELIKKAYRDGERSGREYERIVRYVGEILKAEE